jgi:undecaprenyl diphosphate synthase
MTDNNSHIPNHVAIIMDGNGRWAKQRGEDRSLGHLEGKEAVRDCCEFAVEKGIRYLSIFAFSTENWNRPEPEVHQLMALMASSVLGEMDTFKKNSIRFRVIGNKAAIPADVLGPIEQGERDTAAFNRLDLNVLFCYSGKWDIAQAARRYGALCFDAGVNGKKIPDLDEDTFSDILATGGIPDPDLMIRTGGEERISNFMLWQCAYSEFYFTDVLWPDFRKTQFQSALDSFAKRDRRYGRIK